MRTVQQTESIGHCHAFQIAGQTGNHDVAVMQRRQHAKNAIDGRQSGAAIGRQCVERSEKLAVAWIRGVRLREVGGIVSDGKENWFFPEDRIPPWRSRPDRLPAGSSLRMAAPDATCAHAVIDAHRRAQQPHHAEAAACESW